MLTCAPRIVRQSLFFPPFFVSLAPGPGSLARFIHEDSPNAYGSPFAWVKAMDEIAQALSPEGRVHVVYFEALKRALPSEIQRLANFLELDCTQAKLDAVAKAVGFNAMKQSRAKAGTGAGMALSAVLLRKGAVGDWVNHMTPEHWGQFDDVFETTLSSVELAMPMRHFMYSPMAGLPPSLGEQTVEDDTREYKKFVRAVLKDGNVVRDKTMADDGKPFVRGLSEFTSTVEPAGTAGAAFTAEAGRYHLFVAGTCPWASGVASTRNLLQLQDVVGMDVADGQSGAGWTFQSGSTCASFADAGAPFYLTEVYQTANPVVTTRITVPILWDTQTNTIVSNDSWAIVKMLATAFAPLGKARLDLYPVALAAEQEALHSDLKQRLLNAVYRAGIGLLKGAKPEFVASAKQDVYDSLDDVEGILSKQRYLLGRSFTLVDVRVAMCLLRFDCSYRDGFVCNGGKGTGGVLLGGGYPNICNFLREVAQMEGTFILWESIRQYYRWCIGHPEDQPLPDLAPIVASAEAAHDRASRFPVPSDGANTLQISKSALAAVAKLGADVSTEVAAAYALGFVAGCGKE